MRSFEFPVDRSHAHSVNETFADVRRLRAASIVTALLFAGLAAWLFLLAHPWSYILGTVIALVAATSLWMAFWAPRKVGTVEDMYAKGALVPAVVAEVRPRGATLLALVDVAKPSADRPHYVLVTRSVRSLPGHSIDRVGERVPSVAVLADRNTRSTADTWQMVSPMPIAWGTADARVLRRATDSIGGEEWNLLAKSIPLAPKVLAAENQQLPVAPGDLPGYLLD
ncbi:DUF3239 domain-containing protein [Rhodococcus kronopolitis]|uniref:DUF3239 domain-containing protein n=1 Tax=Rhodococcus kronopolitis TaxID=1460226 RepID=A0ABV9FQH2_9NOCA